MYVRERERKRKRKMRGDLVQLFSSDKIFSTGWLNLCVLGCFFSHCERSLKFISRFLLNTVLMVVWKNINQFFLFDVSFNARRKNLPGKLRSKTLKSIFDIVYKSPKELSAVVLNNGNIHWELQSTCAKKLRQISLNFEWRRMLSNVILFVVVI